MRRYLSLPLTGFACPTAYGVDYAEINAGKVLIKGVIQSVHIDHETNDYVFSIIVRTALRGEQRPSWTILTKYLGTGGDNLAAWLEMSEVYIGFDVVDNARHIGRFRDFGCTPLGIVSATPTNLEKIRRNTREPSMW